MSGEPRPPLAMRLRPPRPFWVVLDWLAAALCWVIVFGVLFTQSNGPRNYLQLLTPHSVAVALLALGVAAPVAFRRQAPARALVIVLVLCAVVLLVGGDLVRGPFIPVAFVLYLVASAAPRRVAGAGLAAALLMVLVVQGVELHFSGQGSGNAVAAALVLTITWVVGYSVQQRRSYMAHVRERAAGDAVTLERLRIARELHDVVAHSMTVVTVQAGYGEYVFDSQPGEARAALGAIQAVSREALGEMQRLLCVLRQTSADTAGGVTPVTAATAAGAPAAGVPAAAGSLAGDDGGMVPPVPPAAAVAVAPGPAPAAAAPRAVLAGPVPPATPGRTGRGRDGAGAALAPAPGLGGLDRLVERTAGAGVQVSIERAGRARNVPASIDLSAYRIVQEALTNVVKHSGAASCRVLVDYEPDALLVMVTDDGPPGAAARPAAAARLPPFPHPAPLPRAGHGLVGMRERVTLCGGEFSAAPRPGGGFRVRARLPLPGTAK